MFKVTFAIHEISLSADSIVRWPPDVPEDTQPEELIVSTAPAAQVQLTGPLMVRGVTRTYFNELELWQKLRNDTYSLYFKWAFCQILGIWPLFNVSSTDWNLEDYITAVHYMTFGFVTMFVLNNSFLSYVGSIFMSGLTSNNQSIGLLLTTRFYLKKNKNIPIPEHFSQ